MKPKGDLPSSEGPADASAFIGNVQEREEGEERERERKKEMEKEREKAREKERVPERGGAGGGGSIKEMGGERLEMMTK